MMFHQKFKSQILSIYNVDLMQCYNVLLGRGVNLAMQRESSDSLQFDFSSVDLMEWCNGTESSNFNFV